LLHVSQIVEDDRRVAIEFLEQDFEFEFAFGFQEPLDELEAGNKETRLLWRWINS